MKQTDRAVLIQRLRWFADNTGDGELFVQAADMLEAADLTANVAQAVPTGKQSLQVAQQESKQEQSNGHGRHDEIRHDHHGDISLDSGAINSAAGKQDLSLTYTTGHCEKNNQKGGCQLHNLQCGWPNCDRKPTGPTPIPQPAVPQEPVAWRRLGRNGGYEYEDGITSFEFDPKAEKLYAAPQTQRPRLSDEDIDALGAGNNYPGTLPGMRNFARLVERKVRGEA